MAVLLLSGCGGETAAESKNTATIDCAIEIQICVVAGLKPGYTIDDGDWYVAAACVLPVHSKGGRGHVISKTDGTITELQWNDVRLMRHGNYIQFDGGQWRIRNRIDRRDGTSQTLGGGVSSPPLSFGTDFDWLASCEIDTGLSKRTGRKLVIRGRILPESPPVLPLNLEEQAGLGPRRTG